MAYSSDLTDAEWEIFTLIARDLIARDITNYEADSTDQLDKARDLQWNSLSTEKWVQLARLTQRPPPFFHRILALQPGASRWGIRGTDECLTWTSA